MDQSLDPPPVTGPTPEAGVRSETTSAGGVSTRRRRERYGLLLAAILAAFAVEGISTPGPGEQIVVSTLLSAALLLALWAADSRPTVLRVAFVIAVAVVIVSIVEAATGSVDRAASRLANLLIVVLAPPAIAVGVVRTLRARSGVTIEAVFAVLCFYVLLGMAFAFLYGAIDQLGTTFFSNGVQATTAHCLYFSFATLTTVGYGDLTARTNLGHTLSATEALLGQIYLVTIVSVFVSNLGRTRRPASRAQS
jgi:Ion channel